ncbi:MAG TPA: ferritin-like domain-containing protein [Methylomirabilota bacterium]
MKQPETDQDRNLTGQAVAPDRAARMVEATREFPPNAEGSALDIAAVRVQYVQELPDGPVSAGPDAFGGTSPLLDKLGERLAFERAGTRLYEALLSKYDAYGSFEGGPSREELVEMLGEEMTHFGLLRQAIEALGGDPTELTPSANLQLTASHGVGQVLVDPATSLVQCLEAIAMAELTDNECWESLLGLAEMAGNSSLVSDCERALATEEEHLEKVRAWLAAAQGRPEVEGEGDVEEEEATEETATRGRSRKRSPGKRKTATGER